MKSSSVAERFFAGTKAVSHAQIFVFGYISLAGLLAYFCLDIPERQLQRVDQIINHAICMKWPGGQAQPFGTFWDRWMVDRLNINLMFV